jgi:hypothetical protein
MPLEIIFIQQNGLLNKRLRISGSFPIVLKTLNVIILIYNFKRWLMRIQFFRRTPKIPSG